MHCHIGSVPVTVATQEHAGQFISLNRTTKTYKGEKMKKAKKIFYKIYYRIFYPDLYKKIKNKKDFIY